MAASRDDISQWFDRGVAQRATHMIVVTDTFDWDDYPVFVRPEDDAFEVASAYDQKNMQAVIGVYSLSMDKEPQITEWRVKNY